MPYKSAKQRAYLHIHHPEIAKRWDAEYGSHVHRAMKRRLKRKRRPSNRETSS